MSASPDPERMRRAVADDVGGVHAAHVRSARLLPPAVQGAMPLLAAVYGDHDEQGGEP